MHFISKRTTQQPDCGGPLWWQHLWPCSWSLIWPLKWALEITSFPIACCSTLCPWQPWPKLQLHWGTSTHQNLSQLVDQILTPHIKPDCCPQDLTATSQDKLHFKLTPHHFKRSPLPAMPSQCQAGAAACHRKACDFKGPFQGPY